MNVVRRALEILILLGTAGCDSATSPPPSPPPRLVGDPVEEWPLSVDLRPAFADLGLAVRPQGERGTCSVFAVIGALEFAHAKRGEKGVALSVEFANWAANEAIGEYLDGSYFSDLWTGFAAYGICDERELPYRATYDPAFRPSAVALERAERRRKPILRVNWIKYWDVKTGLTDEELAEVKHTLAMGWPVCGGFRWPKQARWSDGMLDLATPEEVFDGHSVLLVGYCDDSALPGGGQFWIHDSGRGSREDGSLSYEYVAQYMNDAVWIDPR